MRFVVLYGFVLFCCIIIADVQADKKWKYDTDNIDKKNIKQTSRDKTKNNGKKEFNNKQNKKEVKNSDSKKKSGSNDEPKKQVNKGPEQQKRFIGRIEHGKVKVLRRKEESNSKQYGSDESEEDYKESVCRRTKTGKINCEGSNDSRSGEDRSDRKNKSKKQIKYSIKFEHEKQKKKDSNGDNSILRLHKNERKYGQYEDDSDSSEEDESPIKKRFPFTDDEDD